MRVKSLKIIDKELVVRLEEVKRRYAREGFIILGIFGSIVRGDFSQESDLDLLYKLSPTFRKRYRGFSAFERIESIKEEMSQILGREVDLADRDSLGILGKKYILSETVYV